MVRVRCCRHRFLADRELHHRWHEARASGTFHRFLHIRRLLRVQPPHGPRAPASLLRPPPLSLPRRSRGRPRLSSGGGQSARIRRAKFRRRRKRLGGRCDPWWGHWGAWRAAGRAAGRVWRVGRVTFVAGPSPPLPGGFLREAIREKRRAKPSHADPHGTETIPVSRVCAVVLKE